jgi:hypothetical protein
MGRWRFCPGESFPVSARPPAFPLDALPSVTPAFIAHETRLMGRKTESGKRNFDDHTIDQLAYRVAGSTG